MTTPVSKGSRPVDTPGFARGLFGLFSRGDGNADKDENRKIPSTHFETTGMHRNCAKPTNTLDFISGTPTVNRNHFDSQSLSLRTSAMHNTLKANTKSVTESSPWMPHLLPAYIDEKEHAHALSSPTQAPGSNALKFPENGSNNRQSVEFSDDEIVRIDARRKTYKPTQTSLLLRRSKERSVFNGKAAISKPRDIARRMKEAQSLFQTSQSQMLLIRTMQNNNTASGYAKFCKRGRLLSEPSRLRPFPTIAASVVSTVKRVSDNENSGPSHKKQKVTFEQSAASNHEATSSIATPSSVSSSPSRNTQIIDYLPPKFSDAFEEGLELVGDNDSLNLVKLRGIVPKIKLNPSNLRARLLVLPSPEPYILSEREIQKADSSSIAKSNAGGTQETKRIKSEPDWKCDHCKHSNNDMSSNCGKCGKPRVRKEDVVLNWKGCFSKFPKTWICAECTCPNKEEWNVCKSCNAIRPQEEGISSTTPATTVRLVDSKGNNETSTASIGRGGFLFAHSNVQTKSSSDDQYSKLGTNIHGFQFLGTKDNSTNTVSASGPVIQSGSFVASLSQEAGTSLSNDDVGRIKTIGHENQKSSNSFSLSALPELKHGSGFVGEVTDTTAHNILAANSLLNHQGIANIDEKTSSSGFNSSSAKTFQFASNLSPTPSSIAAETGTGVSQNTTSSTSKVFSFGTSSRLSTTEQPKMYNTGMSNAQNTGETNALIGGQSFVASGIFSAASVPFPFNSTKSEEHGPLTSEKKKEPSQISEGGQSYRPRDTDDFNEHRPNGFFGKPIQATQPWVSIDVPAVGKSEFQFGQSNMTGGESNQPESSFPASNTGTSAGLPLFGTSSGDPVERMETFVPSFNSSGPQTDAGPFPFPTFGSQSTKDGPRTATNSSTLTDTAHLNPESGNMFNRNALGSLGSGTVSGSGLPGSFNSTMTSHLPTTSSQSFQFSSSATPSSAAIVSMETKSQQGSFAPPAVGSSIPFGFSGSIQSASPATSFGTSSQTGRVFPPLSFNGAPGGSFGQVPAPNTFSSGGFGQSMQAISQDFSEAATPATMNGPGGFPASGGMITTHPMSGSFGSVTAPAFGGPQALSNTFGIQPPTDGFNIGQKSRRLVKAKRPTRR